MHLQNPVNNFQHQILTMRHVTARTLQRARRAALKSPLVSDLMSSSRSFLYSWRRNRNISIKDIKLCWKCWKSSIPEAVFNFHTLAWWNWRLLLKMCWHRTFLVGFLYIQDLFVVSGSQNLYQGVLFCAQTLKQRCTDRQNDIEKDHLLFPGPTLRKHTFYCPVRKQYMNMWKWVDVLTHQK